MDKKKKGGVTIPTDASFVEGTKKIAEQWGADAVRDCDGTALPQNAGELAEKVYSTYFVIRGDNRWASAHKDELQHVFLMSGRNLAVKETTEIKLLEGYFSQQIEVDWDTIGYWEVIDRTTGEAAMVWEGCPSKGTVVVRNTVPMHEYTVSFMAKNVWDPVQMYNYLTNGWHCPKQMMYDPIYPATAKYVRRHMQSWCERHPETNVVRFTTFLYQFSLIFNESGKEKYVDWFGYTMSVSPRMLEAFAREYGYRLRAEDLIDEGYYNTPFRLPSPRFSDYMDFVQRTVTKTAKELVDIVHEHGKEAMMFLGDCWIGAEPYGKYFEDIGLDAVVGSVGGGVTVRMLSEIPHVKYREGRFLPYFFPDTFYEGNEQGAVDELNRNWLTARRAIMRKPLDRIGYGGYLSLAAKFPKFVDRVAGICDEFREIYENIHGEKPYAAVRVGILNAWGKLRSWQAFMVAHELWYQQIYSYQGILEALSGLPVDVEFLSFDDILKNGIPEGIDVLVNAGAAGTAFSGGEVWKDEKLVSLVRGWVYRGGGFIGVGEPTAVQHRGRFFQLGDVLGVDKEIGFTLSEDKYNIEAQADFITRDASDDIDYGEDEKNIYAFPGTKVLDIRFSERMRRSVNVGEVKLSVNVYGAGKGIYIAGLPFGFENSRLLYRALYAAAGKEEELRRCFSGNILTECHYYPQSGLYAVLNNSTREQETSFYDKEGKETTLRLRPMEVRWIGETNG